MKKIISIFLAALMIAAVTAGTGVFVALTLPGDITNDGEIDNKDVAALFKYVSGEDKAEDETVYDYNKDGDVDNKDVVSLFRSLSTNEPILQSYVSVLKDGEYEPGEVEDIYIRSLYNFGKVMENADAESVSDSRFIKYAKSEAALLDSAVMLPLQAGGCEYTLSRIAPHTSPYVIWGNDSNRVKGLVISDEFLTKAERAELLELWENARQGDGTYDPAGYLKAKGHEIRTEYTASFSTAPETIDWFNTYNNYNLIMLVDTVDGLVEYDNFGIIQPALAESWDVSTDGLTYTFHLRKGVYWYTYAGEKYAEVTAHDFEAGFHHMLDTQVGLETIVYDIVTGTKEYVVERGNWEDVGCKAADDYTLVITLEQQTPYFLSMLSYSCFLPLCQTFYESKGGVFGIDEYAAACTDPNYTFGKVNDVSSQVYCGSFILTEYDAYGQIVAERNPGYYRPETVKIDKSTWIFFDSDYSALYYDTVGGLYTEIKTPSNTSAIYDLAYYDGYADNYMYISDTDSTTYFATLNLNRTAFSLANGAMASTKSEQEKAETATALNNKYFRQALTFAVDKTEYNNTSKSSALATATLRNMYTPPEFVYLSKDVTADGHTFKAGTFYGDIVQYYLDKLGSPIKVADGQDGWYNPSAARAALEKAKTELGDSVTWPVIIDVPYSSYNRMSAIKDSIESVLGSDNIIINGISGTTEDFYNSGYRVISGRDANFDLYYDVGWAPDFGDPSTYLITFAPYGFMSRLLGL